MRRVTLDLACIARYLLYMLDHVHVLSGLRSVAIHHNMHK